MFDGKMFLPETGIPIRKMLCIRRLFALADPLPLTVAILKAKSLTAAGSRRPEAGSAEAERVIENLRRRLPASGLRLPAPSQTHTESPTRTCAYPKLRSGIFRRRARSAGRR